MRVVLLILVLAGFVGIHVLIGGTRLLYAIPGYGAIAAAAVLSVFAIRRVSSPPQRAALITATLFFGYVSLRAAWSPVDYLAWPDLFLALACLTVYLLFACHLTNPEIRLGWIAALALLALAGVLVGAQQFRAGNDWMPFGFFGRPPGYRGRASGFFICPNHLAGFVEVTGLFTLSIAFWSRLGLLWRLLAAYVTAVCLAGILMSGSRGGFLSFATGLAVLGFLTLIRLRAVGRSSVVRPALVAGISIVVVAIAAWFAVRQSHLLQQRARNLFDTEDVRIRLWSAATEQARIAPVAGTGAGTFLIYGRKFRPSGVNLDPVHAHNDYLELLAEYGLLGGLLALGFLGSHLRAGSLGFRALLERVHHHPQGRSNAAALNIGALAGVAAFVVHSIFDFNLHIPENALVLAAVGGMLANPSVETVARHAFSASARARLLGPRLLLVGVGVVLASLTLPKLAGEWYAEQSRYALEGKELLESARLAREGIEHQKRNPNLYFYLGESNWEQARLLKNPVMARSYAEAALEAYRDALRVFPQDSRTLLQAGWVLARLGRFDEAAPIFASAVEWDPRNATIRTYQGHFLRMKGDRAGAMDAYRAALALGANPEAERSLLELESPETRQNLPKAPESGGQKSP